MLFGLAEEIVEQRRAEFVARHFRKMAETQFARNFSRALFIAKKKNFRPGREARPAQDGVALDRRDMPAEMFGNGEQVSIERVRSRPLMGNDIMLF